MPKHVRSERKGEAKNNIKRKKESVNFYLQLNYTQKAGNRTLVVGRHPSKARCKTCL